MAFTFNAINSALDGSDKLNMFDQQSAKAKPQFGGSSNGNVQLGSSSGSGSVPAATQSTGQAFAAPSGTKSPGAYNPADAQAAFRGIGSVDTSQQRGKISGDIASANSKLQAEADSYAGKVKDTATGYGLDSGTLEKAASGEDASFQAAQTRLANKIPTEQFEGFKGLGSDDITALGKSTSALQNKETYGDIFRPGASANYGTGESRFQSLLLGMDSGFRTDADNLLSSKEKLIKDNNTAQVDKTKEANDTLSKAYNDATGKIRTDLTGMSDKVVSDADKRAVAEAAIRAGIDPKTIGGQEFAKIAEKLRLENSGSKGTLGRSMDFLNDPGAFDLSKYVNVDRDVTGDEMMSKDEVARFNRINGLLGNGNLKTFNQNGAGSQYGFDAMGAEDFIKAQLESRRGSEDERLRREMDQIQGSAQNRAGAGQGDPLQNARDYVTRKYLDQNEGQSEAQRAAEQEAFTQMFNQGNKFNDYFSEAGGFRESKPMTGTDIMSPQEASRMSQIAKELGLDTNYSAGSSYNESNYNPRYFDTEFTNQFDRILAEIGPNTASPSPSYEDFDMGMEKGRGAGQARTRQASSGINQAKIYNPKTKAQLAADAYANSKQGKQEAMIRRITGS